MYPFQTKAALKARIKYLEAENMQLCDRIHTIAEEKTKLQMKNDRLTATCSMLRNWVRKAKYIRTCDTVIPIDSIRIKSDFGPPNPEKIAACQYHWQTEGDIGRTIAVIHNPRTGNYTLIDGYVGYLVLKDAGVKSIPVFQIERES